MPFKKMYSEDKITNCYFAMSSIGRLTCMYLTYLGLYLTVFPRRLPSSGPKMFSATLMSEMLTGKLVSRFLPMIRLSVFTEVRPRMGYIFLANLAHNYKQRVANFIIFYVIDEDLSILTTFDGIGV